MPQNRAKLASWAWSCQNMYAGRAENGRHGFRIQQKSTIVRSSCKIACNIDPLRVDFRVQFRPL
jgi:hypothetical protein